MVCPLPHTAANHLGIFIEELVIIVNISGTVTHGVGVFTEEYGHIDLIGFHKLLQRIQINIHSGINICIMDLTLFGGILAVNQAGTVTISCPVYHFYMIKSVTTFVASGPHNYAGTVLKGLHHPLHTLQKLLTPLRINAWPVIGVYIKLLGCVGIASGKGVGLKIRFANHIEAHLVTHLDKRRMGRIVGGANTVDV